MTEREESAERLTWSPQHNVEVQTIDAYGGVVFNAQVDVFLNTEAKVASGREVVAPQLILAHFKTPFQDLLGLAAAHSTMDGDLLITTNSE